METTADDSKLIVDQQDVTGDTRLPNSHSAALVMGFIFLCVLGYCVYRLCRWKLCNKELPLTVSLSGRKSGDVDIQGIEDFIKDREAYLAIYGPRKSVSTISAAVSQSEPMGSVIIPVPNTLKRN